MTHGWIDWTWTNEQICNFVNAFSNPFQGASTYLKGERVFICGSTTYKTDLNLHPFQCGIILRKFNNNIFVATRDGLLKLNIINNDIGESVIEIINEGDRFYTTSTELDNAKSTKIVKLPDKIVINNYNKSS